MSATEVGLRRQIDSAVDLQAVVRTMKALAASSIGQYERSVRALADYDSTVGLALGACLRRTAAGAPAVRRRADEPVVRAVVFGSDQGLVGRFNDAIADHAVSALAKRPGRARVWAVGERVKDRLEDAGIVMVGQFEVPTSVQAITPLIARILLDSHAQGEPDGEFHLFHNRPTSHATWQSVGQRLLPLDERWRRARTGVPWPTPRIPETLGDLGPTLAALIGEHLFVSLFRACSESLASENASRLAAMERADRNIDELLEDLRGRFNQLRQGSIDEELFDVVAGFDALRDTSNAQGV